jgi:hypothetical protein
VLFSFGIIFCIVVGIGNILYFPLSYYCYQHFDDIQMEKLGTKVVYHDMFRWCQFQHSIVKFDTGLIAAFTVTCFCFGRYNVPMCVIDALVLLCCAINIFAMKYFLRYEQKYGVIGFLIGRLIFQAYLIFRCYHLIEHIDSEPDEKIHDFFISGYGKDVTITIIALNTALLIGQIVSCIKCVRNFGKGLRDMINKQGQEVEDDNIDSVNTEGSV